MSKYYEEIIPANKSFYSDGAPERTLRIEYSVPDSGVDANTGMLLLVPGYGGNLDSHVYTHIRRDEFADVFNIVIVQCDYFGMEFMHANMPEEINNFMSYGNIKEFSLRWNIALEETVDNHNDMGILQAVDIINATTYVLKKINYCINPNKIILFGQSHGAYLSHLANILCPGLYSYILDISGYIKPYFINNDRKLTHVNNDIGIELIFSYRISGDESIRYDDALYDLEYLYSTFDNTCKILSFQGNQDWMVNYLEKEQFIKNVGNAEFLLYTDEDLDGNVFKNCGHGLGLDFILFLNVFLDIIGRKCSDSKKTIELADVDIEDKLHLSYNDGTPHIDYISRSK